MYAYSHPKDLLALPPFVTTTGTLPVPTGAMQWKLRPLLTKPPMLVHGFPPNVTVSGALRFQPVTITLLPPAFGPRCGVTPVVATTPGFFSCAARTATLLCHTPVLLHRNRSETRKSREQIKSTGAVSKKEAQCIHKKGKSCAAAITYSASPCLHRESPPPLAQSRPAFHTATRRLCRPV